MILSDLSIRRPVISVVASLLIVLVGVLAFLRLPVREYPNIDPPVVNVSTFYRGAAAEVVESRITRPLEDQLSTVEGIRLMRSVSAEQSSNITIEFKVGTDIEAAANDVRDRVSRARAQLPQDVREPVIAKVEADQSPFIRIVMTSDRLSQLELGALTDRVLKTRLQTIPGVGNIEMRAQTYAMRLWLDADRLAAFNLTAGDIERSLRQQNVDIPGGRIESLSREFPIRVEGDLQEVSDFENMVIATRGVYQVKLRDVARVELGQEDYRVRGFFRGVLSASIGVIRQSQSSLLEVAEAVKAELEHIKRQLPEGVEISIAFDESVFVERSVNEVFRTIFEATGLVILVIFFFLRDWRSTLIPLLAIPVSLIGTFAVMLALGFTINILTLLALVLSVGLVVDDAIVMLENIYRRVELGEKVIQAAVFGARQVAFAVIATTAVLVAVFLPVAFQTGQTGRLFFEFGVTLAVAVTISSWVALTLTPMLCSRVLKEKRPGQPDTHGRIYRATEPLFVALNRFYSRSLGWSVRHQWIVLGAAFAFAATTPFFFQQLQRELVPVEDRGGFRGFILGPQGSTPEYMRVYGKQMESILASTPEVDRYFVITGVGAGNGGFFVGFLKPWEDRERRTQEIIQEVNRRLATEVPGVLVRASPIRPIGGRGSGDSFIFVLRGDDFNRLQELATTFATRMRESGLFAPPRIEPSPTKPQLNVEIDRAKAADLRVAASEIASSLESLFGGRRSTTFKKGDREYDVILQVEDEDRVTPSDLGRVYVRSSDGHLIQLSNLVTLRERIVPENFPHFDRLRSVNLSTAMAPGKTIGDGVEFLEQIAGEILPDGFNYVFDGETREFLESGRDTFLLFGLALLFTFLILAAQFESWTHPVTIFTGVVLAIAAGVITLYLSRFFGPAMTNNLFSQFGLIMLIGLISKNGILIVEFANQLQIEGRDARTAAFESATIRFRPILMTAISTVCGVLPLAFSTGAGAETRNPLGLVVAGGLAISTVMTLYVIPVVYILMDRVVRKVTGKSSAHGLILAKQIARETSELAAQKIFEPAAAAPVPALVGAGAPVAVSKPTPPPAKP